MKPSLDKMQLNKIYHSVATRKLHLQGVPDKMIPCSFVPLTDILNVNTINVSANFR